MAAKRARSLGNAAVSTPANAPEKQECADGYDGCCGVGNTVTIAVFAWGGADEPVVELGIEASDERVEAGRAHNEQNPCGLPVRAAVGNDQLARDSHEGSLGPRRLVHVPVVRDVDLLLGPGVRDLTNLGQRRIEGIASKCGWRSRPQLILGREKEGPRAEVAECDYGRRGVDPVAGADGRRSERRVQWIREPQEVALREGEHSRPGRPTDRFPGGEIGMFRAGPRVGRLLRVERGFELRDAAGKERAQHGDRSATDSRRNWGMRPRGCLRRLGSTQLSERRALSSGLSGQSRLSR